MPPLSPAAFGRAFRRLDASDRLEFVAALWDARGWETTVEDGAVVAVREGARRRIRVVTPGVLRPPSVDDADRVVATDDVESLRAAAESAGVRYSTAADLREMLCYGVDRDLAAALVARFLDRPFETTTDSGGEFDRDDGGPDGLRDFLAGRSSGRPVEPGRLAVTVVLVAVVGLAVAGPGLLSPSPASTPNVDPVTATPRAGTYTPGDVGALGSAATPSLVTDAELPMGLSPDGVASASVLARTHALQLSDSSYAISLYRDGRDRAPWGRPGESFTETARVESESRYRYTVEYLVERDGKRFPYVLSVFSDGEDAYARRLGPTDAERWRFAAPDPASTETRRERIRRTIATYLDTSESSVSCRSVGRDGECAVYRVVANGTPNAVASNATDYRAVANVTATGFVRSLDVAYTSDGESIQFGFSFGAVDGVTVEAPAWVSETTSTPRESRPFVAPNPRESRRLGPPLPRTRPSAP